LESCLQAVFAPMSRIAESYLVGALSRGAGAAELRKTEAEAGEPLVVVHLRNPRKAEP